MNSGGASSHAPLPLAARGFTRRLKNRQQGRSSLLPRRRRLLPLPATGNTKKRPQTVDFRFVFLCFLDLHFSLLLLRICFIAGQLLWVSSPSTLLRVADRAALLADGGSVAGCGRRCWLTVWTALFGRRRRPWV